VADHYKIELYYILLNIGVVDKPNGWATRFFASTDYRGFLLLIPGSGRETESLCLATAFLYLNNEQSIMCSMIRNDGSGDEPFQCGKVTTKEGVKKK
jgi:hypothetical protein